MRPLMFWYHKNIKMLLLQPAQTKTTSIKASQPFLQPLIRSNSKHSGPSAIRYPQWFRQFWANCSSVIPIKLYYFSQYYTLLSFFFSTTVHSGPWLPIQSSSILDSLWPLPTCFFIPITFMPSFTSSLHLLHGLHLFLLEVQFHSFSQV